MKEGKDSAKLCEKKSISFGDLQCSEYYDSSKTTTIIVIKIELLLIIFVMIHENTPRKYPLLLEVI